MMIMVTDVCKTYEGAHGRKLGFHNISFEIPKGGNLAILSAEDSGRSTFINMIGGLDHPDSGKIRRLGTVSWIAGQMRFEKSMTVSQNLRFLGRILGNKDFAATEAIISEITGFRNEIREPFGDLDDREKKLLNFATFLAFDFDILLFDGTNYGGPEVRKFIEPLIQEKMSQATAVSTAAKPADVGEQCTHVLVLADEGGRLYDDRKEAFKAFRKARGAGQEMTPKGEQEVVEP